MLSTEVNDNDMDKEMESQKDYALAFQLAKKSVEKLLQISLEEDKVSPEKWLKVTQPLEKYDKYRCHFEVLDQKKICGNISPVVRGPWIEELALQNITFSDIDSYGPIDVLIGADVAGNLWTGGHKALDCKLVAVETKLGWTLMGKIPNKQRSKQDATSLVTSMLTTGKISDLWTLDTLGILDPYEKCSRQELEAETQKTFLETVKITKEGRFEVRLPWMADHSPLSDNYDLAKKRLSSTVKKLKKEDLYDKYQEVFDGWLNEKIIEEVPAEEMHRPAHYLPHHPVLKVGSTTPIRPVFDASAHEHKGPSLNQCLEKGPNLIEKIPSVMARFRLKKIGVIADIRKAFLQIALNQADRDFLRFLWTTKEGQLIVYRHCRVVFGVSSSPFLLEASIRLLMEEILLETKQGKRNWPLKLVETLASSFYVDNCVCSVDNWEEAQQFVEVATKIMYERKFELRGWELTVDNNSFSSSQQKSNVLGLVWDRESDTLEVNIASLQDIDTEKITKRIILSTAHRIFDPIGFTCCVTLIPKLLLQHTWEKGTSWDEEVDPKTKDGFMEWLKDIHFLSEIKIPRWLPGTNTMTNWTLHIFSDASQNSYASVAFLRIELEDYVRVQLVAAKSRVAPVTKSSKKMTIPRLELLAASISARLYSTIVDDYKLHDVVTYFWTDATTVLAWIKREDNWNVFVNNRVSEIKRLTSQHEWRFVPGNKNPADLPSRGCSAQKLLESRWWEGPSWITESPENWPHQEETPYNEDDINSEKKRTVISAVNNVTDNEWLYMNCSTYKKAVRTIGWIYRFKNNTLMKNKTTKNCDLTLEEYTLAEEKLISIIQSESFEGVTDEKLKTLIPYEDSKGLLRVKTKEHLRQVANEENSRSTTIREIPPEEDVSNVEPVSITKETRRGRVICVPKRYRN
ncbi:uncharacterized protein LOC128997473 [Macrosteles quadrilineatus]|uniref:uncharacterized protein LOC128997473 n=1 Tax=Macrosteles quadrilineatus TaxID=74068 RepID=UPI0023E1868E|nr:uncharacterized protein LOC128997473 [Macrosteles quadrilineatus]